MNRRNFLSVSMATLGAGAALGAGLLPRRALAGPKYTLKMANVNAASSHISINGYDKFAEFAAAKSNGEIVVHHFPGGQLGSDKETYEAAQQQLLEISCGSFANIVTLTRAFEVLHLPYIFETREQAHRAVDAAAVKDAVNQELNKIGLHWFMIVDYGFRKVGTVSHRVVTPSDLAGLKIRASRSPTEIAALNAFGAAATTVDWPEVYNALKLKVVDGEFIPPNEFYSSKHYELIKYITNVDCQWLASIGVMSLDKWNSYPEDVRRILEEAAAEAQALNREAWVGYTEKTIADMKAAGDEFIDVEPEVIAQWQEAGRSVWAKSGVPQEVIDLVRREATTA